MNFKFSKENFNLKIIKETFFNFFAVNSGFVFMLFFIIIASLCFLLVYKYIYSSTWNDERKDSYLQEFKKGGPEFKLEEFRIVVNEIKERKIRYSGDNEINKVRDIFGADSI